MYAGGLTVINYHWLAMVRRGYIHVYNMKWYDKTQEMTCSLKFFAYFLQWYDWHWGERSSNGSLSTLIAASASRSGLGSSSVNCK